MALSFLPQLAPLRARKRGRATADIDGEHSCLHRKKRRLRLFLITSRLSPHYSSPATNIVDRGSSKIAVWAKQRARGRNLLRKAAILNCIRREVPSREGSEDGSEGSVEELERDQQDYELAKLDFLYGSHDTYTRPVIRQDSAHPARQSTPHYANPGSSTDSQEPEVAGVLYPHAMATSAGAASPTTEATYRSPNDAYASHSLPRIAGPRRSYIPLPPSPLGLSNYDAFDDDVPDPYAHLDVDEDEEEQHLETTAPVSNQAEHTTITHNYFATSHEPGSSSDSDHNTTDPAADQTIYSAFDFLVPGQPVMGDYDQVDSGADAIWPMSTPAVISAPCPGTSAEKEDTRLRPTSSSPNFAALLAPSTDQR